MPKPPPRLRTRTGAARSAARRTASSSVFRCASQIDSGLQVLRAAEEVEALEGQAARPISRSSCGTASASTPNCFGPPPIFMPEDFSSKSGLTRTATRAGSAHASRDKLAKQADLARRLDVDQDAGGDRLRKFGLALARAREADLRAGPCPASSATCSSPPDATSMPSTRPRHVARRAPASDWPSSRSAA